MLHRTLGVIGFISAAAAAGIYFANRPTVARGDVIAADLMKTSAQVKSLECDKEIPFTTEGATFMCTVETKNGERGRIQVNYKRDGSISAVDAPAIKKTSDPWGD